VPWAKKKFPKMDWIHSCEETAADAVAAIATATATTAAAGCAELPLPKSCHLFMGETGHDQAWNAEHKPDSGCPQLRCHRAPFPLNKPPASKKKKKKSGSSFSPKTPYEAVDDKLAFASALGADGTEGAAPLTKKEQVTRTHINIRIARAAAVL